MDEKYVNALALNVSFYDVNTVFMKETTEEINGVQHTKREEIVTVRMSLQLAKAYLNILKENIENYEKLYGEIPNMPLQKDEEKPV